MVYSSKINDPAFDKHLKNFRNYRYQFAFALAIIAIVGFYLYGAFSDEMDNPEALYIGFVIGGMFLSIGIYSVFSLKPKPSWEGEVVEKKIIRKKNYTAFVVYFKDTTNKIHEKAAENDATVYDYFKIGEKVRFHGKLKTIEKFDKSNDAIIFCNACSFMCDIEDDVCRNCGCPLLK